MEQLIYGRNFKLLKKVYANRTGSTKGLTKFMKDVLKPLVEITGTTMEISDEKAWNLVTELYPKWIEKKKFADWEDISNHLDANCFTTGGKSTTFTGSHGIGGIKLHNKVDY